MKVKLNKKAMWILLIVILVIIMNGATIAWIVMNCIDIGGDNLNISYWDAISNKAIYELVDKTNLNIPIPKYHFYSKFLVYIFMLLGYIASFIFFKFLYKHNLYKKERELKEKEIELKEQEIKSNKENNKEFMDKIEKIMKGK